MEGAMLLVKGDLRALRDSKFLESMACHELVLEVLSQVSGDQTSQQDNEVVKGLTSVYVRFKKAHKRISILAAGHILDIILGKDEVRSLTSDELKDLEGIMDAIIEFSNEEYITVDTLLRLFPGGMPNRAQIKEALNL